MFTKTHRNGIVLAVAIAGALTLTAGRAEAGIGDYLVFACASDSGVDAAQMDAAVAACGAVSGKKSACQTLSGSPWVCNTPNPQDAGDETCFEQEIEVTITGSLPMPGGWGVSGDVKGKMTIIIKKVARKTCDATPVTPPPNGNAGSYVAEKFRVMLLVRFTFSAGFNLTAPGGAFTIAVSGSAGCAKVSYKDAHIPADTAACTSATTTTTTGASTSQCCTIEEMCTTVTVCDSEEDGAGCTTTSECRPEEVCMPGACEPRHPDEPIEPVEPGPIEPVAPHGDEPREP
jgi:hypothetical protein